MANALKMRWETYVSIALLILGSCLFAYQYWACPSGLIRWALFFSLPAVFLGFFILMRTLATARAARKPSRVELVLYMILIPGLFMTLYGTHYYAKQSRICIENGYSQTIILKRLRGCANIDLQHVLSPGESIRYGIEDIPCSFWVEYLVDEQPTHQELLLAESDRGRCMSMTLSD